MNFEIEVFDLNEHLERFWSRGCVCLWEQTIWLISIWLESLILFDMFLQKQLFPWLDHTAKKSRLKRENLCQSGVTKKSDSSVPVVTRRTDSSFGGFSDLEESVFSFFESNFRLEDITSKNFSARSRFSFHSRILGHIWTAVEWKRHHHWTKQSHQSKKETKEKTRIQIFSRVRRFRKICNCRSRKPKEENLHPQLPKRRRGNGNWLRNRNQETKETEKVCGTVNNGTNQLQQGCRRKFF